MSLDQRIAKALATRRSNRLLRELRDTTSLVDFSSNDYLGFATLGYSTPASDEPLWPGGATASRLLRGENSWFQLLEERLADFFHSKAALIVNSGYAANLSLFSSLPQKDDVLFYDEFCHASIRDGLRLSLARSYKFPHNNLAVLEEMLCRHTARPSRGEVFVVVEGLYSMDGDIPDLKQLATLSSRFGAHLIVDEAHSGGVYGDHGRGATNRAGITGRVYARIVTFGKAFGCFGAVILTDRSSREYLVNFARPFVYTTALPPVVLQSISRSLELLESEQRWQEELFECVECFRGCVGRETDRRLLPACGPIQIVQIPGNEHCLQTAFRLQRFGYDVRAVLSPTVPVGTERLRITLHRHNSANDVESMAKCLEDSLAALEE